MNNQNSALLFLKLNRVLEGRQAEALRFEIDRKFAFQIVADGTGDHRVYGGFLAGFAPGAKGSVYSLTLTVSRSGHGNVDLPGWVLGKRDQALCFLSVLRCLDDSGSLQYGVFDKARQDSPYTDDFDSIERAAMRDLLAINTNSVREMN